MKLHQAIKRIQEFNNILNILEKFKGLSFAHPFVIVEHFDGKSPAQPQQPQKKLQREDE